MQVSDSLGIGQPMRQADAVSPVQSRAHDAFWRDVFDAATAVQGQADQGLPADIGGAQPPPADRVLDRAPVLPPSANGLAPSPAAVSKSGQLAGAASSEVESGSAVDERAPAMPAALARPAEESALQGRGRVPSTPPAHGGGGVGAARVLPRALQPGDSPGQDMPWQATFVVDAAGQRRLFLRSSELDDTQAMALAARLDQAHPGRSDALEAIHLNGRPIYQQAGDGSSGTLLIC